MTSPNLLSDLREDEGLRLHAYPDPRSALALAIQEGKPTAGLSGAPWTIGFGHTGADVHEGLVWTLEEAEAALEADVARTELALDQKMPWWRRLSDLRQDVLANMAFNLGVTKLEGFVHTLRFIHDGLWDAAASGMLESAWADQVGARAQRLAAQMRTGIHQP